MFTGCDEAASPSRLAESQPQPTLPRIVDQVPSRNLGVQQRFVKGTSSERSIRTYAAHIMWISPPVVYTTGGSDSAKRATNGRAP